MAVDERAVTDHLRPGLNRIAVQVYSPGYSHFSYVHRGACGLIGWLEVDGKVALTTGPQWKVRRDTSWSDRVERVSIYGTGVEDRDLRMGGDWVEADASDWEAARVVQEAAGPIWESLRPRATALPEERVSSLKSPWQLRTGPAVAASGDPHADLREIFATSLSGAVPVLLPRGTSSIWIFDLGESRACLGGVELTAAGGERLLISYAEKLRDGELLLPDPSTYCRMRPTDRFTLRPGRQVVEGFTPRGARYLVFALEGGGVAPAPMFYARLPDTPVVERPLPRHPGVLQGVADMCRRTTLNCLQDGFVDGVWRESSLWLGDVVAQDWALRGISDDPRPLLFAIDMAASGADAEGLLPSVLPGEVPAYAVTDYNFSWVELLAGCATHPGIEDAQAVWQRHWGVLTRMLERMASLRGADGLLQNPPGRRLFLDWSPMSRAEPNLTLNLRYLNALRLAALMADQVGRTADWAEQAGDLTRALQGHKAPDGWRESPGGEAASQLGLALLILTGVVEGQEATALADRIVARSLDLRDGPVDGQPALASPFMHHYLFLALQRLDRRKEIHAIIAARWGRWVREGRPTTPENWSIDFPDGSACHGFAAHPLGWL
ncbi:family 78 glycoside hydrolase catalytic domain [Rhodobacter sp. SY28-1]|uniref:alpha-L-rhamnosidase-related protein n=1 Tax=Rhodobacter sp. SY28-1 TaxID=2562317 RepID=UPI0010C03765|nr:family 78 glycoside hydrolase catalytic domain [Rhodobacter sp. SY28-1]